MIEGNLYDLIIARGYWLMWATPYTIVVQFGPKSERIAVYQMHRTPSGGNVAGFLDDAVPALSSALHGGKVESFETETILEKCLAFKRNGRY